MEVNDVYTSKHTGYLFRVGRFDDYYVRGIILTGELANCPFKMSRAAFELNCEYSHHGPK